MAKALTIRTSESLHERLCQLAKEEGISLNQYVNMLLLAIMIEEEHKEKEQGSV